VSQHGVHQQGVSQRGVSRHDVSQHGAARFESTPPQDLAERALELSRADGAVVIVDESSTANLRWANNTLTTNGVGSTRRVTVISTVAGREGTSAAVLSKSGVDLDSLEELVRASEAAARDAGPAQDARALPGPPTGVDGTVDQNGPAGSARWSDAPASTSITVFDAFAPALGDAFASSRTAGRLLFGFAEHTVTSTYLATSTGLRLRHDQPTGRLEVNAKSSGFERSAWAGATTRDFSDVDVTALDTQLAQRLEWQKRRVELAAGRYETLLPPTAVADLMIEIYWTLAARDAADGHTVFSRPGGGTRVGDRLGADRPGAPSLRIWSDPFAPGLECAPFNIVYQSSAEQSVFDNGLPLEATDWVRGGVLEKLVTTRQSAQSCALPVAPPIDNLLVDGAGVASLEEMVAATDRGLLLTSLWYIRQVDPQSLLLTGLTRDGVYLVEGGEVTGAVNNFRFNESPVDLLSRVTEVGRREICLPRESSDYMTRTAAPTFRIPDFNMSSVSKAS
jgi:predicted Zn-dependent protease